MNHEALLIEPKDGVLDRGFMKFVALIAIWLIVTGAGLAVLAYYERPVGAQCRLCLGDGPPILSSYYLLRTFVAVLLSILGVGMIYGARGARTPYASGAMSPAQLALATASIALTAGFAVLFVIDPRAFNALAQEDHIVEWASAGLCLLASAFLVVGALNNRNRSGNAARIWHVALASLFAVLFFLIGMEEVSWMQRVVGFATPERFGTNYQNEANLHNFATGLIEHVYYFGAFVFLVLGSFIRDMAPRSAAMDYVSDFIPTRFVAVASAPIAAFNYDMWNAVTTQVATAVTLLILLFYHQQAKRSGQRREALVLLVLSAVLLVTQILFIALGDNFVREWDVTEYKELFISLGFACFAYQVLVFSRGPARRLSVGATA